MKSFYYLPENMQKQIGAGALKKVFHSSNLCFCNFNMFNWKCQMWLYYLISVDWAYKPRNEVSDDAILPNPPNAIMCLRKEHKKSFQYMVKSLHFIFQIWVKGENCRHNVKKEVGNRARIMCKWIEDKYSTIHFQSTIE